MGKCSPSLNKHICGFAHIFKMLLRPITSNRHCLLVPLDFRYTLSRMHMFLESTTMNDRREQKSQNNWNIGAVAAASASVALLFFSKYFVQHYCFLHSDPSSALLSNWYGEIRHSIKLKTPLGFFDFSGNSRIKSNGPDDWEWIKRCDSFCFAQRNAQRKVNLNCPHY